MWLREGHRTSPTAHYPQVAPTYIETSTPARKPQYDVSLTPLSHTRPYTDWPSSTPLPSTAGSRAYYFSSILRHSPMSPPGPSRALSPASLLRSAACFVTPNTNVSHVRHPTMTGSITRTPSPLSGTAPHRECKTDLASFAAATQYQPKPIRFGEPRITGELAVVRSPRESSRGRELIKPSISDASYRRSSRSRRPVSEQATLRPHFSLSGSETVLPQLAQPQRVPRASSGLGRFASTLVSAQTSASREELRSLTNVQATASQARGVKLSDTFGNGTGASPFFRGQHSENLEKEPALEFRSYSAEKPTRKKVPVVPPLALTKVVSQQQAKQMSPKGDALVAPRSQAESYRSAEQGGSDPNHGVQRVDVNPWARALVVREVDTSRMKCLPAFSDNVKPCLQPILPNIRPSSSVYPAYQAWISIALRYGWIEECSENDCHILLKPKIRKTSDGQWRVQHDCSIVNAMATATPSPSCQWPTSDVHKWALGQQYIGRLTLLAPTMSVPLELSQKPYYAFKLDGCYYRYSRMPAGCVGASRHLQRSIKWALQDLPPELSPLVRFRGDEIFCGGKTAQERDIVIQEAVKALGSYGFKLSRPYVGSHSSYGAQLNSTSSRNAKVLCAGLIHDRGQQSLVLPSSKIQLFERLVAELHTPRWAAAAEDLLKALHQIAIIMPVQWKRESNTLRRILQSDSTARLLDPSVYLVWDELPRRAAGWHAPFERQQ